MSNKRKQPQQAQEASRQERTPRSRDERKDEVRGNDTWVSASKLPTPDDRDGLTHKWIRTSMVGKADTSNVSQKFREGWTPVKAEDYPELKVMSDIDSRFSDGIEIGGLLLCSAPTEWIEKRREMIQRKSDAQMESVDRNFLRQNDPRMPLLNPDRSTRTTFGRG